MKVVRIGILPQREIRGRMLAIASGKLKPKPSDPRIWFTSMRSLSQVLSDENRALLEVIRTARPASISELAEMTGRKQSNLSRTLKTMSRYGLVRMERADRQVRPIVEGERYQIVA
jgi:predicted transcriptional regulator